MKTLHRLRAVAVTGALAAATTALGTEATGTEAVGSMNLTGGEFGMLLGGLLGLGGVVWIVTKVVSK